MDTTGSTLALLRRHKYSAEKVERYDGRRSHDFMGFADVLAYRPEVRGELPQMEWDTGRGALAVQTTVWGSMRQHLDKMLSGRNYDRLREWLLCHNRVELWGWPDLEWIRRNPRTRQDRYVRFVRLELDGQGVLVDPVNDRTELLRWGHEPFPMPADRLAGCRTA